MRSHSATGVSTVQAIVPDETLSVAKLPLVIAPRFAFEATTTFAILEVVTLSAMQFHYT